jgi:predicted glycosyltransferase
MYSHDTFGLGHIRRTRAIANSLVKEHRELSILILSGSSLAGSFNFGPGIDFVHVPSVTKRADGSYDGANLRMDLSEVTRIREALIRQAAEAFRPDVFISDKEPTGFRGELVPTLDILAEMGTRRVIGIRDVLDDPDTIRSEWHEKGAIRTLTDYYEDILVYGSEEFYRPLDAIPLPAELRTCIVYTGYLRRTVPGGMSAVKYPKLTKRPFILVTTGGGADGAGLIDWVISAYEADPGIPLPAVILYGPFLSATQRTQFAERVERLPNVEGIIFDPKVERLMNRAAAVVGMGGYNTFCEILSFDKPALLVPRARPRLEQTIRAQRAADLGLVRMLADPVESGADARDPMEMAAALTALCTQARPSAAMFPDMLDGHARIADYIGPMLDAGPMRQAEAGTGAGA